MLTSFVETMKVDGNVFLMTTANNMCGRSFYQFSPVFAQDKGFEVVDMDMIGSPLLAFEAKRRKNSFGNRRFFSEKFN